MQLLQDLLCLSFTSELSCPIAAHDRRPKSTTVFASNDPRTRGDSSTCTSHPFGKGKAGFEHWLQDIVLWVHDYAVSGKDPLAAHTDGSLFLEGDIAAVERRLSSKQLVQGGAEGVDVVQMRWHFALHLLRAHVNEGAGGAG